MKVVYKPSAYSDLLSTLVVWAKDEAHAKELFEQNYPMWEFKSAEPTKVIQFPDPPPPMAG